MVYNNLLANGTFRDKYSVIDMDGFQKHIRRLIVLAFLILSLPVFLWLVLHFAIMTGVIGTFCGVYLAFILNQIAETMAHKKRWRNTLIAALQSCEINRGPLENIRVNLGKILDSNFASFGKFLNSRRNDFTESAEEEHFRKFLDMISAKIHMCDKLMAASEATGYKNLLDPEILRAIGSDDLYNKILIAYKEIKILSETITMCMGEIQLMQLSRSRVIERFEELRQRLNTARDQASRAKSINDNTYDLIKSELMRFGVNVSSFNRLTEK